LFIPEGNSIQYYWKRKHCFILKIS